MKGPRPLVAKETLKELGIENAVIVEEASYRRLRDGRWRLERMTSRNPETGSWEESSSRKEGNRFIVANTSFLMEFIPPVNDTIGHVSISLCPGSPTVKNHAERWL